MKQHCALICLVAAVLSFRGDINAQSRIQINSVGVNMGVVVPPVEVANSSFSFGAVVDFFKITHYGSLYLQVDRWSNVSSAESYLLAGEWSNMIFSVVALYNLSPAENRLRASMGGGFSLIHVYYDYDAVGALAEGSGEYNQSRWGVPLVARLEFDVMGQMAATLNMRLLLAGKWDQFSLSAGFRVNLTHTA